MKIGIDTRILSVTKTGIGYYVDNILKHLFEIDKQNEYLLFCKESIDFDIREYPNVKIIKDKSLLPSILWYILKLPYLLKKSNVEVFWGTQHILPLKVKNIYYVLTIHDLVYHVYPKTMKTNNRISNFFLLSNSINKADRIISVSYSTKNGLIKYYGSHISNKIEVVYEAAIDYKRDSASEKLLTEKFIDFIKDNYILYLGTIEPRKNIDTLLDAYEILRENYDCKLILGGKFGWKSNLTIKKMTEHRYKNDIIYLGYVEDNEKYFLMNNCKFFIFPSFYEGFGLPVVEAMKCGTVPIVANNSSLKELVELEYLKFETNSSIDLANKILNLVKSDSLYKSAEWYCREKSKQFKWRESAVSHKNILCKNEEEKNENYDN